MHRLLISLLLVAGCFSAAAAETPSGIVVPPGTQVKMYVLGAVSPDNPQPGDRFTAQAASDVVVDGLIVVRKGAEGRGTITTGKLVDGNAAPKSLVLVMDWVYAVDGGKLSLSASRPSPDAKPPLKPQAVANVAAFGIAGYFGVVTTYVSKPASVHAPAGVGP